MRIWRIVGHSHRPGVWERGGKTLINTGAFSFPGKPWCAVIGDGQVRVERLIKTDNGYHRDAKPVQILPCESDEPEHSEERLNRYAVQETV